VDTHQLEHDMKETYDEKTETSDIKEEGGRKRMRLPPSLSEVAKHRFRGSEKSSKPVRKPLSSPARIRTRIRGRINPEENEVKNVEEDVKKDEKQENLSGPVRLRPGRRGRPRLSVGQSSRAVTKTETDSEKSQEDESRTESRTRTSPRRGSSQRLKTNSKDESVRRSGRPHRTRTSINRLSISRGRQPQGETTREPTTSESTESTTTIEDTTTTTTTTTSTTTTTEKVTINPNAHHIVYTLDDEPELEDELPDVIIELPHETEYPDYIVENPMAQELKSPIPVPGDVFSQATHTLMKSHKRIPGLTDAKFRPTLFPRRTSPLLRTQTTETSTAPVFKATTNIEEATETVEDVIREYVQDTIEKEEREADIVTSEHVTEVVTESIQPLIKKRGRFILAIGANGK